MRFKKNDTKKQRQPRVSNSRTRVNTYYRAESKNEDLSPFRAKPVRSSTKRYIFGFLDIVVIIVLLTALGYSLLISSSPRVLVNNQAFHNTSDYQSYALQIFSQLKNRNKVTFDDGSVSAAFQRKFPEVTAVSTELPIFSERPTLRITVAQASLRLKSGANNYIIDSQGIIVGSAAGLTGSQSLPQIVDQSGYHAGLNQPILNASAVRFIRTVATQLKAARVPVSSLTLPPIAQELDLRTADKSYYVKFYLGGDALTETGQFLATRHHFSDIDQPPSEYLDVRIAGKVFYK